GSFALSSLCLPLYQQLLLPTQVKFSLSGFVPAQMELMSIPGVSRDLDVTLKIVSSVRVDRLAAPFFSFSTLMALPFLASSLLMPLLWRRHSRRAGQDFRMSA